MKFICTVPGSSFLNVLEMLFNLMENKIYVEGGIVAVAIDIVLGKITMY